MPGDELGVYYLAPEVAESIDVFQALGGGAFARTFDGTLTGIDRTAMNSTMQMMGVKDTKAVLLDLLVVERELLEIVAESRAAQNTE